VTWFKVDDSFAFHSKAVAAGASLALWVRAGSWCAQQLTDGFIPLHMVSVLGTPKAAARLVDVGLWEEVEGGFAFHDWSDYQPLRAEVEHKRNVRAAAGALGGLASGAKRKPSKSEANASANGSGVLDTSANPRPDPSRPTEPNGSAHPTSARDLVGEWVDHCGDKDPPERVKGQVAKELKAMLTEGIPVEDVRAGLAAWHAKGLHPSALASVVHETRTAPQRNGTKPSTTDQRVSAALALLPRMAALDAADEAAKRQPPAIGH
jgi:hypothetical protein